MLNYCSTNQSTKTVIVVEVWLDVRVKDKVMCSVGCMWGSGIAMVDRATEDAEPSLNWIFNAREQSTFHL
jgi:hypothetical protein